MLYFTYPILQLKPDKHSETKNSTTALCLLGSEIIFGNGQWDGLSDWETNRGPGGK